MIPCAENGGRSLGHAPSTVLQTESGFVLGTVGYKEHYRHYWTVSATLVVIIKESPDPFTDMT